MNKMMDPSLNDVGPIAVAAGSATATTSATTIQHAAVRRNPSIKKLLKMSWGSGKMHTNL